MAKVTQKVRVKYIGAKDFMPDIVTGSGVCWTGYGDVQEVTEEQADKLFVHDDEFAEEAAHNALLETQAEEAAAEAKRLAEIKDAEEAAHNALLETQAEEAAAEAKRLAEIKDAEEAAHNAKKHKHTQDKAGK
jgi:hypothetical protein